MQQPFSFPFVIVHDFHGVCFTVLPREADSPLIVDTNTVLPLSIPFELFQSVSRRDPKVFQRVCTIDEKELS
jgi:hypothetical protein